MTKGKIVQVSGSVVDVAFEKGKLPKIKEALTVSLNDKKEVTTIGTNTIAINKLKAGVTNAIATELKDRSLLNVF